MTVLAAKEKSILNRSSASSASNTETTISTLQMNSLLLMQVIKIFLSIFSKHDFADRSQNEVRPPALADFGIDHLFTHIKNKGEDGQVKLFEPIVCKTVLLYENKKLIAEDVDLFVLEGSSVPYDVDIDSWAIKPKNEVLFTILFSLFTQNTRKRERSQKLHVNISPNLFLILVLSYECLQNAQTMPRSMGKNNSMFLLIM